MNPIKLWPLKSWILYFIFIPLIVLGIFILPQSFKDSFFILKSSDPTLIFLLFSIEHKKKLFYVTSGFLLILLPFISSLTTIYFLPKFNAQGFSITVSGFIGYYLYAVVAFIKKRFSINTNTLLLMFIMLNVTILLLVNYNLSLLTLVSIFLTMLLITLNLRPIRMLRNYIIVSARTKEPYLKILPKLFYFGLSLIFIFYLPFLIPDVILSEGVIIYTFGHFLGYMIGIYLPIFIQKLNLLSNFS